MMDPLSDALAQRRLIHSRRVQQRAEDLQDPRRTQYQGYDSLLSQPRGRSASGEDRISPRSILAGAPGQGDPVARKGLSLDSRPSQSRFGDSPKRPGIISSTADIAVDWRYYGYNYQGTLLEPMFQNQDGVISTFIANDPTCTPGGLRNSFPDYRAVYGYVSSVRSLNVEISLSARLGYKYTGLFRKGEARMLIHSGEILPQNNNQPYFDASDFSFFEFNSAIANALYKDAIIFQPQQDLYSPPIPNPPYCALQSFYGVDPLIDQEYHLFNTTLPAGDYTFIFFAFFNTRSVNSSIDSFGKASVTLSYAASF